MAARNRILLVALVTLGLALRGYHYLRGPAMWHDEAAAVVNVLSKGYLQLLGPLLFHNPSPPLFLWAEKAVSQTLGDDIYALRLPPFLASCAALLLLAWVAGRLLEPRAVPWAVFLFAVSEQLAWHACEAKPYAFDVLAGTVLLTLYAATRTQPLWQRLLLFTLPAPVLIFLSYPAIFLYGGVLAVLAAAVWREKSAPAWIAYGLLALTAAGAFLVLLLGPIRAQHDPVLASCWAKDFAPWDRPWFIPVWTVLSTLEVGRYCCKPVGEVLTPLAVIGAAVLWRRGARGPAVLLAVPVLLALAAAFLHHYPYGGDRVMVFAAPAFVLLVGAATPPAWDWLRRRHRLAPAALALLFLPPLYAAVKAVVFPWARADSDAASAYVEANRKPTDLVGGSDWQSHYYFRRLGPAFCDLPITTAPGGRCWVVYDEEVAPERRFSAACALAPPGWVVVDRRDFRFVTVLLAVRPEVAAGQRPAE